VLPHPLRRLLSRFPKHRLFRLLGFYPPYLGAGVRVREVSPDLRSLTVEMPLTRWNRNYVGTHFGGSLYSLADPWFMLILMQHLGDGYVVWDKAASIRFVKPGRGTVRAHFEIPPERIAEIRAEADRAGRTEPVFQVAITDARGETVAEVEKRISVRTRERAAAATVSR
jgi:acyl-coenzyme A thioesterase PaaI-like protein